MSEPTDEEKWTAIHNLGRAEDDFLQKTREWSEHPDDWDGPCECHSCLEAGMARTFQTILGVAISAGAAWLVVAFLDQSFFWYEDSPTHARAAFLMVWAGFSFLWLLSRTGEKIYGREL